MARPRAFGLGGHIDGLAQPPTLLAEDRPRLS